MPPMVPCDWFGGTPRFYSYDVAKRDFPSDFQDCCPPQLEAELFIESATGVRANGDRMRSVAERFGSNGKRIIEEALLDDGQVFLVEPVADWMALRNMLSLTARLLGRIRNGGDLTNVLAECGFAFRHNGLYRGDIWLIPLKYSCFEDVRKSHVTFGLDDGFKRYEPLFDCVTEWADVEVVHPFTRYLPGKDTAPVRVLSGDCLDVFLASQSSAEEDFRKVFGANRLTAEQKTTYLVVRDNGDQEQLAKEVVRLFFNAFRCMEDEPVKGRRGYSCFLGWECADAGIFGEPDCCVTECRSFASSLMYYLFYHPSMRITVCALCGNAVLSNYRGTRKEYCSDSCRVRGAKIRKSLERRRTDE